MLRHSYDDCNINHTISVENFVQIFDRSYDNVRTDLKIFCLTATITTITVNSVVIIIIIHCQQVCTKH